MGLVSWDVQLQFVLLSSALMEISLASTILALLQRYYNTSIVQNFKSLTNVITILNFKINLIVNYFHVLVLMQLQQQEFLF